MHLLKLVVLILLTLCAMRLLSWLCLWLVSRLLTRGGVPVRLAANGLALCAFAVLLMADSVPGEWLDLRALAFGIAVFAVFFAIDCWRVPPFLERRRP